MPGFCRSGQTILNSLSPVTVCLASTSDKMLELKFNGLDFAGTSYSCNEKLAIWDLMELFSTGCVQCCGARTCAAHFPLVLAKLVLSPY